VKAVPFLSAANSVEVDPVPCLALMGLDINVGAFVGIRWLSHYCGVWTN
jgi:hypothetical protein